MKNTPYLIAITLLLLFTSCTQDTRREPQTEMKPQREIGTQTETGIIWLPEGSFPEQFKVTEIVKKESDDYCGMTLYFHSGKPSILDAPAELLLIDPQGRKTGYDPTTGVEYNEIPNSGYEREGGIDDDVTGEPAPDSKELDIWRPIDGEYELKIIGTGSDNYDLYIDAYDRGGNLSDKGFYDIPISPKVVHTYIVNYSRAVGSKIEIYGGFDGKGQRPRDVNKFLSFSNPSQMTTELPLGETTFGLFIFYDQAIIPRSFKAELNKEDISHLFSPSAGGDQVVRLNLVKGRNTLVLSVDGTLASGRIATDSDRLVFIVP